MIGYMATQPPPYNSDSSEADTTASKYTLFDDQRPWTANAERTWHYHKRADMVRRCRERFGWHTIRKRIPKQQSIYIVAQPHLRNGRSMPDVGACFPTVKAAIDGIVDAGTIPNDTPEHLLGLIFLPPEISGFDGLSIHIIPGNADISEILGEIRNRA